MRVADRIRLDLALGAAGNVGVWDADLIVGRVYGDANFARIYGLDPAAEAEGHPLGHHFASIHPEDRGRARAAMDRLLAGEVAEFSEELRIFRPDGTMRWVLARGRPVRDEAGRAIRLPGVSLDITDRKQAQVTQEFLLDLLDRLRALGDPRAILEMAMARLGQHLGAQRAGYAELAGDLTTMEVITCHADGVPVLASQFALDMFGLANARRLRGGLTVVQADVQADPANAGGTFRALGTRGVICVPLMRDHALRATVWIATTVKRDWDPAEVSLVEDVAARVWDTVERARAEAALRRANALLEERIQAALEARARVEDALRQSQKMEAIGQLTGGLAHDFNNMLQGISSAVELMRRRIAAGRTEEAVRYVEAAQAGVARAAALTQRLLAFSRRQALAPRRVEMNALVEGVAPLLRQTLGPAITVELRLAVPCWAVQCDPNQLENALLNLAINARDAMPGGGLLVVETAPAMLDEADLAGQPGTRPGAFGRLSVRDTGQGMTPDVLSHALEPFFTTKPAGQGTGLGLSQVYGFVSQSNGLVRLESVAGQGTEVHLFLPRATPETVPAPGAPPDETPMAPPPATVLLVEDEADIRGFVAEALGDLGCQVLLAEDGRAGLDMLRAGARRVDMLVTDVGLPGGLDGRQLAAAARSILPDLPVLLITGYAGEAQPAGIGVLVKPFTLGALVERLTAALRAPATV